MDKEQVLSKIEDVWYNIKYGTINLIQWLPIIWKDRDYDHYFLMRLLEFKLNKMGKSFKKYNNHTQTDAHVKQVNKCANIFKRLYEDEYLLNSFKNHDKKWGNIRVSFEECENPDFHEIILKRKNVITEQDKTDERKESKVCSEKGYENQRKDLKEVFRIMYDNILTWWD